jgi:uncharacterized protein YbbC (DUF1343 family)
MEVGLDQLTTCTPAITRLMGSRVGVLAHAASVDRELTHIIELLSRAGVNVHTLLGPEHGFVGAAQDMASVSDDRDEGTGVRVISLYGDDLDDLIPRPEDLAPLDVLLIDLTDVGARYYTYVWTALLAVRAAAAAGVHCLLLDRPNPLGGNASQVEGHPQQKGFTSFVGWERVPIRHGLTLAEMVLLYAQAEGMDLGPAGAVSVLGVRGWSREQMAPSWDRAFVLPSPNMPTFDTALVYPGGCLLEGTNMSDGRGHTRPFELSGAPWLDGAKLARDLAALGLAGYTPRPVGFIPTFHKHAGEVCEGVQIHVTDPAAFRPVATYTAMIALAHHQAPDQFRFRTERYEFVDDIPAFDLLTGSAEAREAIGRGEPARDIAELVSRTDPAWTAQMDAARAATTAAAW